MPGFNQQKFDREIKSELDSVRKQLKETIYKTVDYGMKLLAFQYSPVWTGSYVLSHRIGINGKDDIGPTIKSSGLAPGIIPPRISKTKEESYRKKAASRTKTRLNDLPDKGKITIYNSSPHALLVEVLPDKYLAGTMAPYFPYLKMGSAVAARLPFIMKIAEKKYKK